MDTDLRTSLEKTAWLQVRDMTHDMVKLAMPVSLNVRALAADLPRTGRIWYHPYEKLAFVNHLEELCPEWDMLLLQVDGVEKVASSVGEDFPDEFGKEPWVLVKQGAELQQLGNPLAQTMGWKTGPLNAWMGGPNTLASTLTSGVLGAGAGYGLGWLGEQLLPQEYFERGKLRRSGAMLGALGAGLPTLYWGARANGFGKHLPDFGKPEEPPAHDMAVPEPTPYLNPEGYKEAQGSVFREAREALQRLLELETGEKRAQGAIGGLLGNQGEFHHGAGVFVPMIPVGQFNQMIWDDPFTPPQIAAATSGLVDAAGVSLRSSIVSPADVARIATGMGSGWVSGMLVGKTLGALAGLKPEAQKTLQQTGMWAGALKAVVPSIFR